MGDALLVTLSLSYIFVYIYVFLLTRGTPLLIWSAPLFCSLNGIFLF